MAQNGPKLLKMAQNGNNFYFSGLPQISQKRPKTAQNGSNQRKMAQNGYFYTKWSETVQMPKMAQNSSKWPKTAPNGPKLS